MERTSIVLEDRRVYNDRRECVRLCDENLDCVAIELWANYSGDYCELRPSILPMAPSESDNRNIFVKVPNNMENGYYIEGRTGAACIEGSHLSYVNETIHDCMHICDLLKDDCKGLEFDTAPADGFSCRICGKQGKHCHVEAPVARSTSRVFIKEPSGYNFSGQFDVIVPRNSMWNVTMTDENWDRTLEGCAWLCTILRESCDYFNVKGNYPLFKQCKLGFRDQEFASSEFMAFSKINRVIRTVSPTARPSVSDMLGGAAASSTGAWKIYDSMSITLLVIVILLLLCICCICFILWMKQKKIYELRQRANNALLDSKSVEPMSLESGSGGQTPVEANSGGAPTTPGFLPHWSPSMQPAHPEKNDPQSPSMKLMSIEGTPTDGAVKGAVLSAGATGPWDAGGASVGISPSEGSRGERIDGDLAKSRGTGMTGGAMAEGAGAMSAGSSSSTAAKKSSKVSTGYKKQTTVTSKTGRSSGAAFQSQSTFVTGGAAAIMEQFAMEDMEEGGFEVASSSAPNYKSWHEEFLTLNDTK